MTTTIPTLTLNNGGQAGLDSGGTLSFDHADPEMVAWLNGRGE